MESFIGRVRPDTTKLTELFGVPGMTIGPTRFPLWK